MKFWRNLPIAGKLYAVIGTMAVLIACELAALHFAMRTLSAVRAFVGGEGLWSKAQKNSALALQRYAVTRDEKDFQAFLEHLKVNEGDHQARLELSKAEPDTQKAREGFLRGQIHPDDIDAMIQLLRRFYWEPHLARAIRVWTEADGMLDEYRATGLRYRELLTRPKPDHGALKLTLQKLDSLNVELTRAEGEFSDALGEGSRWLEQVLLKLLFAAVLTVEVVGLSLTFLTSRSISRGLSSMQDAAKRIGDGDFDARAKVVSNDEIGELAESINSMGVLLKRSYADLERRVQERTLELSELAEENAKLYQREQQAVNMRDEFMSIASHELKTPLTALHLNLENLKRQINRVPEVSDSQKIAATVQALLNQSKRLATLTSELMDLTRIRIGKLEPKLEKTELSGLVLDIVRQMSAEAARHGSALTVRTPPSVVADVDHSRISQVLINLISNALKYGNGQPIEVRLENVGGRAHLHVSDRGPGIATDVQERIFDRFERAQTDQKIAGLGLGLYISKQIALAHSGTLSVRSQPGEGSVFTLEVPLERNAPGEA